MKVAFAVLLVLTALLCSNAKDPHDKAEVLTINAGGLSVGVNVTNGVYYVVVDGAFWLLNGPTAIHSDGVWYKSEDKLKFLSISNNNGTDDLYGAYNEIVVNWQAAAPSGTIPFTTKFLAYNNVEVVIFTQEFPRGLPNPRFNATDDVLASFPTFPDHPTLRSPDAVPLFYYTYQDTFAYPHVGNWNSPKFPGGAQGGAPLFLYDKNLRTLAFSPFNNFMVAQQTLSASLPGNLAFGLNAKITQIPAGTTHKTILVGGHGINGTMYSWGDAMLKAYKKKRTTVEDDITIKTLGYWTDNGAYYYYLTEPNKTYEQTMYDVKSYLTQIGLPVKNYQLDSWWYFKGINNGVTLWEVMPSIFPNGFPYFSKKFDEPLALHNRYFAPDTPYQKNFSLIVEKYCALPADQKLFDYIMGKAKEWGMVVYEQDWLVTTYMNMEATQNSLTNSRNWMMYMGNAASKLDLTIQYCMPLPRHVLQSVEIQSVTQVRATTDYQPSNNQWQIFHTSQLIWSLGMYPFKDDFWTTNVTQPNCRYSLCVERNPVLETLAAALSAGPVGPSDQIGKLNKDLVMRTCRASGDLIKADVPATPLDSTFLPRADGNPAILQLASSHTAFGDYRWYYLIGAGLPSSFNVSLKDFPGLGGRDAKYFDYFEAQNNSQFAVRDFVNFEVPAAKTTTPVDFRYYVIAPVLQSGWVFLGETSKFITVSKNRITSFVSTQTSLQITVVGTQSEPITLSLINTADVTNGVQTYTTHAQKAVLSCAAGASTCKFA